MSAPAVFLDRDDTLVVDPGFIDHPDKVTLMPDAAEAVRRCREVGYKVVVATNQSGIARGYFDEARLSQIHDRLRTLLSEGGGRLDAIYYCPFLEGPEASVRAFRRKSDWRKPAPGMLFEAARELDLDLSRSWMIGDGIRDIEAGQAAGCRTILVDRHGRGTKGSAVKPDHCTQSLIEAVMILERESARDVEPPADGARRADPSPAELLTEIRDLLDRQQRASLHDDFSIRRLLATLVQMLTLVVAAWAMYAMVSVEPLTALPRFALAGFLQLVMITLTLADLRR